MVSQGNYLLWLFPHQMLVLHMFFSFYIQVLVDLVYIEKLY
jgi:hypothetical protein